MSMWEPFTEGARRSIVLAQEEAYGDGYIAPHHILLGILRNESDPVAKALLNRGLTVTLARQYLEAPRKGPPAQEMVFTPRAKQTIELAFETARLHHHTWVGSEHLVCGIVRTKDATVLTMFHEAGIPLDAVEPEMMKLAEEHPNAGVDPAGSIRNQIGALQAALRVYVERGQVFESLRPDLSELYARIEEIAKREGWDLE